MEQNALVYYTIRDLRKEEEFKINTMTKRMEPLAGGQVRDDGLDDGGGHSRGAEQG